jgi:small-conductance mechanosensitive channel
MLFAILGLGPSVRLVRSTIFKRNDRKWLESQTHYIMAYYMRPLLLWSGIILVCRALDPLVLATEASHAIKQRFVNFVRSLSTVLAFAFCTASLTRQVQKVLMDNDKSESSRNVGVQFIGNSIYTSVWVAAVCLFMELLGFSTQKWITAGGFGTVLLTLAGREVLLAFSIPSKHMMIFACRVKVTNAHGMLIFYMASCQLP